MPMGGRMRAPREGRMSDALRTSTLPGVMVLDTSGAVQVNTRVNRITIYPSGRIEVEPRYE